MADDRHEVYRIMFGTSAIRDLYKEFEGDFDPAEITYNMLQVKHYHPEWLVPAVVRETQTYLEKRRAVRREYHNKD